MANSKLEYNISGMDCPDCAVKIKKHVKKIHGIKSLKLDYISSVLQIETADPVQVDKNIRKSINSIGYNIDDSDQTGKKKSSINIQTSLLLIVPALFIFLALLLSSNSNKTIEIALLSIGIVIGGYPIAKKALTELRLLHLGINSLMCLGRFRGHDNR